ncbi:MAG: DUF1719 domain-containing protein, partial [Bifidobacteriaceae bacterium]|nr:DUF1719 domain-containing protein [Bifidobacteriaceae bacterium]
MSVVACAAVCLVVGCTGSSGDNLSDAGVYQAEFERAAEGASGFVRGVLEDGTITPEEHRESEQAYLDCLVDHGLNAYFV